MTRKEKRKSKSEALPSHGDVIFALPAASKVAGAISPPVPPRTSPFAAFVPLVTKGNLCGVPVPTAPPFMIRFPRGGGERGKGRGCGG